MQFILKEIIVPEERLQWITIKYNITYQIGKIDGEMELSREIYNLHKNYLEMLILFLLEQEISLFAKNLKRGINSNFNGK